MRIDLLVQKTVFHNFLRIPQITFLTLSSTVEMESSRSSTQTLIWLLLTSLKLSFKYHLLKSEKWRLIYWCKRLLFTIFCGFRKVRFHCNSPQLKWNQAVLLLKQLCGLLITSLKLSFKYHLLKSQKNDWFTGEKDCCSQFLRIPQSTFPLLPSTVDMESRHYSTQTMTWTSSNIVKTFV